MKKFESAEVIRSTRFIFILIMYLIVASIILNLFMIEWGFREDIDRFDFNSMMDRTSHKPFVYRILIPTITNITATIIPETIKESTADFLLYSSPVLRYVRDDQVLKPEIILKYHITYFILYISLLLLIYAIRYITKLLYDTNILLMDFAPIVAVLLLPLTFVHGGYFYDFPELLLMAICLIFIIRKNLLLYYLTFILAALNKESNVLIFLFFIAFNFDNLKNKKYLLKHFIIHGFLSVLLIFTVRYIYIDNPGYPIEFHLFENLKYWFSFKPYISFFDIYSFGIPIPKLSNILFLLLILFFILYDWQNKSIKIKRLLIFTSIILIPLSLCFGYYNEIRNLSLVYPGFYLVAFHTLCCIYNKNIKIKPI